MDTSYAAFGAGMALFFGTHIFSAFRGRGEGGLAARIGRGPYMGLFSLISLLGLGLLIWGYDGWRNTIGVWDPPVWTRHIALTLMLPAMIALVAAYAPRGHIKAVLKHPMLVAVKIWAVAHLAANGDLASMILFGSFLVFAVVDRIAVKKRESSAVGPARWFGDAIAVGVGAVVYVGIAIWAHPVLIGVPVLS